MTKFVKSVEIFIRIIKNMIEMAKKSEKSSYTYIIEIVKIFTKINKNIVKTVKTQ